ncbi:MAG: T9SS type A sorting domain-containing protein [Bacteroidales bacterium]|nr:T9SS type A sorting domain-containing protein [Bacteroidales bacterium]
MKRNYIIFLIFAVSLQSQVFPQDYRDQFVGKYNCSIHHFEGNSSYWYNGEIFINKSDSDSSEIIITRETNINRIATVDTNGNFIVYQNPYGEWGNFITEFDSIYYFVNHGSPMGLYDYYYGKKENELGNETFTVENSFLLYPNPTSGIFKIEPSEIIEELYIEILNLQGQTVYSKQNIANDFVFDISGLDNGIYISIIKSNCGCVVQKIIKQ